MIKVANVERIRWAHSRDGMSIRAVARAFRVSRKTVRRALADPGPWEYHRIQAAPAPVMDPVATVVEHRLRSVLVRPGRDRLTGRVEVDETCFGGEEPGLGGGRAKGKKVLVGVAVELRERQGYGRCRMAILRDGSAASLHPFVTGHVELGATVITDGWQGYHGIENLGYIREPRSQRSARARGEDPGALLPGVHRVASLAKRWHLGTHQGRVDDAHLQVYLDEFVFRFNRRRSRSRGMVFYRVLELAVAHDPVRYRELVANPQPKKAPPRPPGSRGHPPSMERPKADRPWRTPRPGLVRSDE